MTVAVESSVSECSLPERPRKGRILTGYILGLSLIDDTLAPEVLSLAVESVSLIHQKCCRDNQFLEDFERALLSGVLSKLKSQMEED
jgi:hypothetical protein